jgi:hypothetical protein
MKWSLGLLTVILLAVGCESPLVGLGEKVDITAPTLVVNAPVNGAYVKGTVNLTGSFQDDAPGVKVLVSIDGGTTFPLEASTDQAAKTWTLNIDTTDEVTYGPEGEKEFWLKVQDVSGKENLYRHLLFFDNKPPTVMLTEPAKVNSGLNGNVIIRGEASDTYGLDTVTVRIFRQIDDFMVAEQVADGTTSWSTVFDSAAAGSGIYYLDIIAADRSGNENVHFYHYLEVYTLGTGVTVDTLRRVENSGAASDGVEYDALMTKILTAAAENMLLNVTQDADLPVFAISNPTLGGTLADMVSGNILSPNAKLIGQITDDDAVRNSGGTVPQIRIIDPNNTYGPADDLYGEGTSDDIEVLGWTPITVTNPSSDAPSITWSFDPQDSSGDPLTNGAYYIQVRAEDIFGATNVSAAAGMYIDSGVPVIVIDSHDPGEYINTSSFVLSGTASASNPITDVEISFNGGSSWASAVHTPGPDTWTYTTPAMPDGSLSVVARVTDSTGKTALYNLQVNIDATEPEASFLSPSLAATVNGVVTLRGTSSDATSPLKKVELQIGKTGPFVGYDAGNDYNWELQIDTLSYTNATYANEQGADTGVWRLPIRVRVTDEADNIYTSPADGAPGYYYFDIDNERDKPIVTIDSPVGGRNYGGSVLIVGSAFDDDAVGQVYMQILGHQSDTTYDALGTNGATLGTNIDIAANVSTATVTDGTWISLGSDTRWNQTLNSGNEFYASGDYTGEVTIRVVAVDTKGATPPNPAPITGNVETLNFTFDATIPTAESIQINGIDYSQGAYVNGTFTLTGVASDNSSVNDVNISYNGGGTYFDVATPGTASYNINESVNTATINSGEFAGTSGQLNIRIEVKDDNSPTPNTIYRTLNLSVDNLAPVANYDSGAADPVPLSGTTATLLGEATDITGGATLGAVDRIEVYIEKSGLIYDPGSFNTSAAAATRDPGYGFGAITYPPVAQESYIMVIDDRDEGNDDSSGGGDGDGFDESLINTNGVDNTWSVQFDSNNLPDGAATIHFIVVDRAGNGAHYTKNAFISNNPPSISSVTLGTDLDGDGNSTDPGETVVFSSGYGATDFNVRNNYLTVAVSSINGNSTKRYSLDYGGSERNGTLTSNNITVTDFATIPDASGNGATFTLKVFDSTTSDDADDTNELSDSITIGMNIQNTDNVPATITVAPFGQTFNDTNDDSAKVLSAVSDYEDNIKMSGSTRLGHVEYAAASMYSGLDPDISGEVIFKGKVEDNQRIQRITATVPGYNSGNAFDVYTSAGGALAGADWAFAIDGSSYLTEANGNVFNWDFTFDSAAILTKAAQNVSITFTVYDFNGGNTPGTSSITVDIVPYITDIVNPFNEGLSSDVIRSSTGKYSMDFHATNEFTVYGFNLGSGGYPPSASLSPGVITAPGGLSPAATLVNDTEITVRKNVNRSGFLTIFVNGIPSINNITTNNSPEYRKEIDPARVISEQWTDDRYLWVWETTQMLSAVSNQTFYYPDMIMNGTQPVFSYNNDNQGSTNIATNDTTNTVRTGLWYERQTAIGFADGVYWILSAQDAFSGGSIGYLQLNGANGRTSAYGGTQRGNNIEIVGQDYSNRQLNRFRFPKMIAETNGADSDIYIAYYDSEATQRNINFVALRATSANSAAAGFTEPANDASAASPMYTLPAATGGAGFSQYYDMVKYGADSIAIVYYDQELSVLRLAYTTDATGGNNVANTAAWTTITVDSDLYNGSHVSMTSDGANLYIAYYDSARANLKFVTVAHGAMTVGTPRVVDAYLSVGTWTNIQMMDFDGGAGVYDSVPVITYYSDSFNGTKKPIKMAFPVNLAAMSQDGVLSANSEAFSGYWEVMNVPAASAPKGGMMQFNHTQVGEYANNGLNLPVVGWLADRLEYAKLQPMN